MPSRRRRGYRELLLLLGLVAFGASVTGSFWVVFLTKAYALPPTFIAGMFAGATFVAAATAVALSRFPSLPATRTMIAGLASLGGMQIALATLQGPPLYVSFAVLYGLYIPLFFLPWNTLLVEQTRVEDRGAKLAGVPFGYNLAAVGAPFVGGVVAQALGFPRLFLLGTTVLVVAAAVAAALSQDPDEVRLRLGLRRLGGRNAAAYMAQGGIDGVLWTAVPLVALSFVQGEVQLGALFSLFLLAGGVFGVALGRWSDRLRHRRRFLALGAALPVPLALAVAFAPSLPAFALANGLLSATLILGPTFVNAIAIDRLAGEAGLVMTTREVLLNLSRGLASVTVLALFLLGFQPQTAILLVAIFLPLEALAR
jgi:MFS family permease